MKRIIKYINLILSTLICTICMSSCFPPPSSGVYDKDEKMYTISSYEELIAINSKTSSTKPKSYKLVADIDCNYSKISAPLEVKEMDGQGFTIKNCYLQANTMFDAEKIKNLNLENIHITNDGDDMSIVSNDAEYIENVHVRNSSIVADYEAVGNGYIGGVSSTCPEIVNCSVVGTKIRIVGEGKPSIYLKDEVYVGGIVGKANKVSNCFVEECTIYAQAGNLLSNPHIGGISGWSQGKIKDSYVKNSDFTVRSSLYTEELLLLEPYTIPAYMGGSSAICEETASFDNVYTIGNTFNVLCCGDLYLGGVVGKMSGGSISQCYAKENIFNLMIDWVQDAGANQYVGGMIGDATNAKVTSSVAYNGDLKLKAEYATIQVAGFVSSSSKSSFVYCASYNKSQAVLSTLLLRDEFCISKIENAIGCYISSDENKNENNFPVLEDDFWGKVEERNKKLNLEGEHWSFF